MDLTEYFQDCVNFAAKGRPVNWMECSHMLYNGFMAMQKKRDDSDAEKDAKIAELLAKLDQ